jgi:glutathione S-transferase
MADISFFHNPMSRGQIAHWALHEAGVDFDIVPVEWDAKPEALLAANPMGKIPTIVHHTPSRDIAVTEAPAICHYLAEIAPDKGLLPREEESGDYCRWMFFAAGPLEQAIIAKSMGWDVPDGRAGMVGFGSYDLTVATLEDWLATHDYVCGTRFTMADVYVGSAVDWGLAFGTLPDRPAFAAYAERLRARDAYRAAKAKDNAAIAEKQNG